ncbi:unnamed protein product, partial [Prunus brigantina]
MLLHMQLTIAVLLCLKLWIDAPNKTKLHSTLLQLQQNSMLFCFFGLNIIVPISWLENPTMILPGDVRLCRTRDVTSEPELCQPTSKLQHAILYTAIAVAIIGMRGTRYTMATMGANQFENPKNQATYFNWFFFTLYAATVVSITAIVYVEDNVSWRLGFGMCAIANLIGLVIFLCGARFYRFDKPQQGSPFVGMARVVVASARKRNLQHSSGRSRDYYYGHGGVTDDLVGFATPSSSFSLRSDDRLTSKPFRFPFEKMLMFFCSLSHFGQEEELALEILDRL